MKWVRFRIKTITDAEDIIISTLYDIGLEGAQIEDKIPLTPLEKEQMFVDILPDGPADDGLAYLSFFVYNNLNYGMKSLSVSGGALYATPYEKADCGPARFPFRRFVRVPIPTAGDRGDPDQRTDGRRRPGLLAGGGKLRLD